jgi:hypothetical protein
MKLIQNVVGKGIVGGGLFLIVWSLGYVFGAVMILFGLRDELKELIESGDEHDELDKMIEKMNEMGPNN